jgi:hypothetical protein
LLLDLPEISRDWNERAAGTADRAERTDYLSVTTRQSLFHQRYQRFVSGFSAQSPLPNDSHPLHWLHPSVRLRTPSQRHPAKIC